MPWEKLITAYTALSSPHAVVFDLDHFTSAGISFCLDELFLSAKTRSIFQIAARTAICKQIWHAVYLEADQKALRFPISSEQSSFYAALSGIKP